MYTLGELGVGIWLHLLVLLSDGFHNLSDVVALAIGLWASKASKRRKNSEYTYGWARTELLGALVNGCFLLSLSLYITLEAIPKFISPEIDVDVQSNKLIFVIGSGVGVGLNVFGAIVFLVTGKGHSHSHGHEHEGHTEDMTSDLVYDVEEGDFVVKESTRTEQHGHSHDSGHAHSHESAGHDHSHGNEGNTHDILEEGEVGHSHAHSNEKKEPDHGHSHAHGSGGSHEDHNLKAIFLHFVGDAISSLFVLGTALLLYFFDASDPKNWWVLYIDPTASLLVVIIILYTTIPLVKSVLAILLQRAPKSVDVNFLTVNLGKIPGVISVHDLHIWQLVDGMNLASVHLDIKRGSDFSLILKGVRKVFHKQRIHSVTVQPEFEDPDHPGKEVCEEMCVEECQEAWCCEVNMDGELLEDVIRNN